MRSLASPILPEENEETERVIEAVKDITLKDVKANPDRFKEF